MKTDLQGTTIADLVEAARTLGFEANSGTLKRNKIDAIPLPAIAHLDHTPLGHFVVLYDVTPSHVIIADPARGLRRQPRGAFEKDFRGNIVLLSWTNTKTFEQDKSELEFLWDILRPHKGRIAFTAVLAILGLLGSLALSAGTGEILDRVIPHSDARLLYIVGAVTFALLTSRWLCGTIRSLVLIKLGNDIDRDITEALFLTLLKRPLQEADRRPPGDDVSLISDITTIVNLCTNITLGSLIDILLIVIVFVYLAIHASRFGILALTFTPLIVLPALFSAKLTKELDRTIIETRSVLLNEVIEVLENLRTVRVFGLGQIVFERLFNLHSGTNKAMRKRSSIASIASATGNLATSICTFSCVILGASWALHGTGSIGQMMFFYTLLGFSLSSLERLGTSVGQLRPSLLSVERVSSQVKIYEPATDLVQASVAVDEITLSNCSFARTALRQTLLDIDFTIQRGETIAIVGETGSGKSTLAAMICMLYEPSSGTFVASSDGTQISQGTKPHTGAVFQEPSLFSGSIRENISAGRNVSDKELLAVCAQAGLSEVIENLPNGLSYNVGHGGAALSSGQRQRVAIARALIGNPALLILDEATGNLDPDTEERVMDSILNSGFNRSTIIVTHRLSCARKASRIYVVEKGTIVQQGNFLELETDDGPFRRLFHHDPDR